MPADRPARKIAEEVLALDREATPGPWEGHDWQQDNGPNPTTITGWEPDNDPNSLFRNVSPGRRPVRITDCEGASDADRQLIARYRTLAPDLARALLAAEERAERATAEASRGARTVLSMVAAEREACAHLCASDAALYDPKFGGVTSVAIQIGERIAAAIRARSPRPADAIVKP